jgi:hypothetical protein
MDELTDSIGITLPMEARTWWGWHDGAFPPRPGLAAAALGPQREFVPLEEAVQACVEIRDIMRGIDGRLDSDLYQWVKPGRGTPKCC